MASLSPCRGHTEELAGLPVVSEAVSGPSHHKPPTLSPIPSQGLHTSLIMELPKILLCKTAFSKPAPWGSHAFEHVLHFVLFPPRALLPFLSQRTLGIFNLPDLESRRVSLIWGHNKYLWLLVSHTPFVPRVF